MMYVFVWGVSDKWLLYLFQAVMSHMDSDVQSAVKYYRLAHDKKSDVKKLKWMHVEGAFGLLCLGHFLSILIFLLEILYYIIDQK